MNRKDSSRAAGPRGREPYASGSKLNWARTVTIIGGGAIGLSIILFIFSLISAVLVDASNTLNSL